MSSIYKKTNGALKRVADSQGILVPKQADWMRFLGAASTTGASANSGVSPTLSYYNGKNWIENGKIKIPVSGVYAMKFYFNALNTDGLYTVGSILVNGVSVGEMNASPVGGSTGPFGKGCANSIVYHFEAGDIVEPRCNANIASTAFSAGSGTIAKISQEIPDIYTDATRLPQMFMGAPDYAQMETTNRITAATSTWTVERDGYVRFQINAAPTVTVTFMINGKSVSLASNYWSSQGCVTAGVLPVIKGDVISIANGENASSYTAFWNCYFIPPKSTAGMGVTGADLVSSLDQGKVAIDADTHTMSVNDNYPAVGVEQNTGKRWIDGSPIYCQAFTGNIVAAANTSIYTGIGTLPVGSLLIDVKGMWKRGDSYKWIVNSMFTGNNAVPTSTNVTRSTVYMEDITGIIMFSSISEVARTGTSNNGYQIVIYYTKP
jgi:hypothetical protein